MAIDARKSLAIPAKAIPGSEDKRPGGPPTAVSSSLLVTQSLSTQTPFLNQGFTQVLEEEIFSYCDVATKTRFNFEGAPALFKRKASDAVLPFMNVVNSAEQDSSMTEYACIKMLSAEPSLASIKMPFPQGDGNIRMMTALQKTFFSLDSHLRNEIMRYMRPEDIKQQLGEYLNTCKKDKLPIHVDLKRLKTAMNKVNKLACTKGKLIEADKLAIPEIGGAQEELRIKAINFIHQICHPKRRLCPTPDFPNEQTLPRSISINYIYKCKQYMIGDESGLGTHFFIMRAWFGEAEPGFNSNLVSPRDLISLCVYEAHEISLAKRLVEEYQLVPATPPRKRCTVM